MNDELRDIINKLTLQIIEVYHVEIPIHNMNLVVEKIGGKIETDPSLSSDSDGFIQKSGENSFVITISPYQSDNRKNFTIAHELGHLFLHMGFKMDKSTWRKQVSAKYFRKGNSEQEYEANEFAAAFLMPKEQYQACLIENLNGHFINTAKIAEHFNVSEIAASNRGKWLGMIKLDTQIS